MPSNTDELHEIHVGQTPETDAAKASWLERVVQAANYALRRIFEQFNDHVTGIDPHPDVYLLEEEILQLIADAEVMLGFYNQLTDQVNTNEGPLGSAVGVTNGKYYMVTQDGAFITSQPDLVGAIGAANDRIIAFDGVWRHLAQPTDYLSSVVDDTAAGEITFQAKTWMQAALDMNQAEVLDLPNPSGNNSAARKRYVDDGDAAVRAYADDQDAAHVDHLDPHEQYVERTEAVATFVFAAYAGLQAPLPITGPATIDDTWAPLTFGMSTLPAIPLHMTVDAANGTIQPHYNGMYAIALTVAFEHNSFNSGRTTRLRVYNITQDIGGAGVVIGTGRNAEATSGSFTILMHTVNDNDVFRMEIGGGDDYTQIDWDAIGFQMWSVGPFSGQLGSDTQYADIDVDALMAPALADVPSNDNAPIKAGVLRRLLTAIINILKQIESRHD